MKKHLWILLIILGGNTDSFAQHIAMKFSEAERNGIIVEQLDSIYKSAVHADTSLAVFKSNKQQEAFQKEYVKLLKEFGKSLTANNFRWTKPTRCFNRIYFNMDGTIDYFLFNFLGEKEMQPAEDMQIEFARILNNFIGTYKIKLTANVKFAQCSPVTYLPD